ncbi:MAG: putative rane protein/domain [Chthonomonadales bacterium]|nr:putative rane protein/domain [Chthonomonadales bacterium]
MSRTITVVTPENITVTYRVAGFAPRFLAFLIDFVFQLLLIVLIGMVIRLFQGADVLGVGNLVTAASSILVYLVLFAYPMFWEMGWGGRTPGKRLFGLRVIREGGYPINLVSSVLRNVLRLIDFGIIQLSLTAGVILFGLPGLACIFFSPTYKRIGDYAGGTLVIVEEGYSPFGTRDSKPVLTPNVAAFLPLIKNIDRVTVDDYRLIRRFTSRRAGMDLVVQASIGDRLARPLIEKLELELNIGYQVQFADLLEAIERRYAEERGVL